MLQSCKGKGSVTNLKKPCDNNDSDQLNTCIVDNQSVNGEDDLIVKPLKYDLSQKPASSTLGKFFKRGNTSKSRLERDQFEATTNDNDNDNKIELNTPENSLMVNSMMTRARLWANRHKERLVHKNGECNLAYTNVPEKSFRFILDIFTTLLDMQWTYTLLICIFVLLSSFLIFAVDWFLIALANGDTNRKFDNDEDLEAACVQYVNDFTSAFLFSIETQHTIGYGRRVINTKCRFAIISLCLQSCFGLLVQSLFTGLIFAKLSRPKRRGETIMFSERAVICFRDGIYCLIFRMGDMRNQHFIAASVKGLLLRNKRSDNGENVPIKQETLHMLSENSDDNSIFLGWPCNIIHKITSESPLFNLSADSILEECFELVVILGNYRGIGNDCTSKNFLSTGRNSLGTQAQTLITYQKFNCRYRIDYSDFHDTIPIQDMPECSARDYANKTVVPNFSTEDNWATLSLKGKSTEKRRFSKRKSTDIRGAFKKFKRSSIGTRHHESMDR